MMTFERIANVADLWDGDMESFSVRDCKILLVRVDGAFHAYRDRCAHLGYPLSEGRLDGRTLTCRAHEWQYDVTTGRGINPRCAKLTRIPIRIDGSDVLVDAERPEP